ncbi:MAG: fasciclin domain-containing protein, partial [Thiogranum sp.]
REGFNKNADETRQNQDTRISSNTAPPHAHEPDLIETATAAGDFNTLIKAVVAADLYDTLRGEGPFTLFAPTDGAFAKLPDGMLDELLANKDMLVAVLSYHVVPGRLTAADLLQQRELKTVQGQTLSIAALDVVSADIGTANGIVHIIGNVVMPSL